MVQNVHHDAGGSQQHQLEALLLVNGSGTPRREAKVKS